MRCLETPMAELQLLRFVFLQNETSLRFYKFFILNNAFEDCDQPRFKFDWRTLLVETQLASSLRSDSERCFVTYCMAQPASEESAAPCPSPPSPPSAALRQQVGPHLHTRLRTPTRSTWSVISIVFSNFIRDPISIWTRSIQL